MKGLHSAKAPRLSTLFILLFILLGLMLGCDIANAPPPPTVAIAKTRNPLVARYSITSGCTGQAMVEFGPDTSYGRRTTWQRTPGRYRTADILVAGMRASTTYHMRSTFQCLGNTWTSDDQTFTTGPLPSTPFPSITVSRPNPSAATENPGIEMFSEVTFGSISAPAPNMMEAFFTDRDGHPIWYYEMPEQGDFPYPIRLLPNGHLILTITKLITGGSILREVDLSGSTVRELDINVLAQKVNQAGYNFVPGGYHHDVLPLDNGHLIVLMDIGKDFTDLPGYPGTTNVIGDGLIDLDENWNPVWAWNSFDYLDVNRHLGGLPDWTHGNAVIYSPEDGNLLLSMRQQSWILKIDYNNGAGTGNVLWKLGYQGDFSLAQGDDPSLWFSFQHFPSLISQDGSQTTLAIWDNGNNRVLDASGTLCNDPATPSVVLPCFSRATIFQIDESTRVANLQWQDSPQFLTGSGTAGYFSLWGGAINQLENGNVEFDINSPTVFSIPNLAAEIQEVTQTSTPQIVWKMQILQPSFAYRAYRIPSLYPGVTWQY